ncbi:MAG: hypothetical protein ACE5FV_13320 [Woeseia sp.]
MTNRLGNLFRRRTAIQAGRQNPILLSAVDKSSEIYDQIPLRHFIGADTRGSLGRQLYLETNLLCNSLEPVATCREKLAATMMKFASYQVLIIPPPPEEDVSGLRSQPGITGGLKENLLQIVDSNYQLCSEVHEISDSPNLDVVWDYLQRAYWQTYWFLETFNVARIELGDVKKDRDWFLPFKHAACANCEHAYRREIELPPAFDEDIASEAATAYSFFTDIVISGAEDPEQEWRQYHKGINIPLPDFG